MYIKEWIFRKRARKSVNNMYNYVKLKNKHFRRSRFKDQRFISPEKLVNYKIYLKKKQFIYKRSMAHSSFAISTLKIKLVRI